MFLGTVTDVGPPWLDVGSEEENAVFTGIQYYFPFMEFESEFLSEEITNL